MVRVMHGARFHNHFAGGTCGRSGSWHDGGTSSAPQLRGVILAAGRKKGRGRVKRNRVNMIVVPRQSRHTSRRRVVGGQPPQLRCVVAAAGRKKGRGWMKRNRENRAAVPLQSRHTSH